MSSRSGHAHVAGPPESLNSNEALSTVAGQKSAQIGMNNSSATLQGTEGEAEPASTTRRTQRRNAGSRPSRTKALQGAPGSKPRKPRASKAASAASSSVVQTDGNGQPSERVPPVKKRKRTAEGASATQDKKASAAPPRKRKKQDAVGQQTSGDAIDSPAQPIAGASTDISNAILTPDIPPGKVPGHTYKYGGKMKVKAYLPGEGILNGLAPQAGRPKGKGKGKAVAESAAQGDLPAVSAAPIQGIMFFDTPGENPKKRKDKGKAKAEDSEPGPLDEMAPDPSAKRQVGRPKRGIQPKVPINEILDLRVEPEDKLAKGNQTWKVAPILFPPPKADTSELTTSTRSQRAATRGKSTLAPRVWASSREELYATIPALAPSKATNSVYWVNCETPIVMLDDHGQSIRTVEMVPVEGSTEKESLFDLMLTRRLLPAATSAKKNVAPVIDLNVHTAETAAPATFPTLPTPVGAPSSLVTPFESKVLPPIENKDPTYTGLRIILPARKQTAPQASTQIQQHGEEVDAMVNPNVKDQSSSRPGTVDEPSTSGGTTTNGKEPEPLAASAKAKGKAAAKTAKARHSRRIARTVPPEPLVQVKQEETDISLSDLGAFPGSSSATATRTNVCPSASAPPTLGKRRSRPSLWLDTSLSVIDLTMDSPLTPIDSSLSPLSPLPEGLDVVEVPPTKKGPLTRRKAASQEGPVTFLQLTPRKKPRPTLAEMAERKRKAVEENEQRAQLVQVKAEPEDVVIPMAQEESALEASGTGALVALTNPVPEQTLENLPPPALQMPSLEQVTTSNSDIVMGDTEPPPSSEAVTQAVPADDNVAAADQAPAPETAIHEGMKLIDEVPTSFFPTNAVIEQPKSPLPSLPMEIRTLIDSFIQGTPVSIIASYDRIYELLPEASKNSLSKEFALAYLGFFSILDIEETTVQEESKFDYPTVQWKFRLRWNTGGEATFKGNDISSAPWWQPSSLPPDSLFGSPIPDSIQGASSSIPQSFINTLSTPPLYLLARQAHPNYPLCDLQSWDTYFSLVPHALLVELNSCISDEMFPTGWICTDCGKINFQVAMRHRKCGSTFCAKAKKAAQFFSRELDDIRGPHGRSPICLPFNEFPKGGVKAMSTTWNNGMKTFSYYFDEIATKVFAKHIFTSNVPALQTVSTTLLVDVQREIQLKRSMADSNNPYFTAKFDLMAASTSQAKAGLPGCLLQAQDLLVNRATVYAEVPPEDARVTMLNVVGWTSAGSRKNNSEIIEGTKGAVVILCLGCDLILSLTPSEDIKAKIPRTKKGTQVQFEELASFALSTAGTSLPWASAGTVEEDSVDLQLANGKKRPRKVIPSTDLPSSNAQKQKGSKPRSHLPEQSETSAPSLPFPPGGSASISARGVVVEGQPQEGHQSVIIATPVESVTPLAGPSSIAEDLPAPIEEPAASSVPPKLRRMKKAMFTGPVRQPDAHVARLIAPPVAEPPEGGISAGVTVSAAQATGHSNEGLKPTVPDAPLIRHTDQTQEAIPQWQPPVPSSASQLPLLNQKSLPATDAPPPSFSPPRTVQLSMVHGDVAVVCGGDFEYSLKRLGPSILIFGSSAP